MTPRIHRFPLSDPDLARLFCGDFDEGDGWTTLPEAVTCPECQRRQAVAAASKATATEPSMVHPR